MPGLTLNTDAVSPRTSVAAPAGSPPSVVPSSAAASASAAAQQLQQARQPTQPPSQAPAAAETARRPPSPTRPPISPITPPLGPTHLGAPVAPSQQQQQQQQQKQQPPPPPAPSQQAPSFAAGRPALAHATQPAQDACAVPPPPPVPLDFDANPDVLALKSAISILQLQRARAAADIAALGRAKDAALADPDAFLRDLAGGRVGTAGDPLFGRPAGAATAGRVQEDEGDDEDDDESSSDEDMEAGGREEGEGQGERGGGALGPSPMTARRKGKGRAAAAPRPPWGSLPRPQSVVRCPPINWSQYAVVGDSLDKLHSEQLARPTQGAPAVVGPGGAYEFRGEPNPADGRRLVGVAAPYTPGRDKIDRKPKGARR